MARLHIHSQALLLLILVVIIHPSCEAVHHKHLSDPDLVDEVCGHTSNDRYCINAIIPSPPLSAEELASTALGWAQIRTFEARTIITSLLKDSSILAPRPQRFQGNLQKCSELNMNAMAELWLASNLFESRTLDAMVDRIYRAARHVRVCQNLLKGTSFRRLRHKNSEIIKLSEICVVSTKYFKHPLN